MTRREEIIFNKRIDKMEADIDYLIGIIGGPATKELNGTEDKPENDYESESLEVENDFESALDESE